MPATKTKGIHIKLNTNEEIGSEETMHTLPAYLAQFWEVYNYCATKAQKLSCQHDKTKQPAKLQLET